MGLNVQWKGKDLRPGVDVLLNFARLPNVAVKASCLPCYVAEHYPFPTLHPQIRRVVDDLRSATNHLGHRPVADRLAATVKPSRCSPKLDFLSAQDKEWIMGRALANWLRWPLAEYRGMATNE